MTKKTYSGTVEYQGKVYQKIDPKTIEDNPWGDEEYLLIQWASPEVGNIYEFVNFWDTDVNRFSGIAHYSFGYAGQEFGFDVYEPAFLSERACLYKEV